MKVYVVSVAYEGAYAIFSDKKKANKYLKNELKNNNPMDLDQYIEEFEVDELVLNTNKKGKD